jgi:5-methylcytosine-specific restriction enzyme A
VPRKIPVHRPPWMNLPGAGADCHRQYNRHGRDKALLKLYGSGRWQKFRALIMAERVLCERCKAQGLVVVGEMVHHKIDPRDNPDLAFDPENVELLCRSCHSRHHGERQGEGRRRPGPRR